MLAVLVVYLLVNINTTELRVTTINKVLLSFAVAAGCHSSAHAAPDYAFFDAATGRLRMDDLQADGHLKLRKVVIQLIDPGSIKERDRSITSERITFTSSDNVLRIPRLVFGGVIYIQVSLTNPGFTLVSVESATEDPVTPPAPSTTTPSTNTLDVRVTVQGTAVPLITINNVPRPINQSEFCKNPELQQTVMQNVGAYSASWTMTSCTFNGTEGRMDGLLTISDPVSATLPVVANFSFR